MTKDDFLLWKTDPVTEEVFKTVFNRREELKERLVLTAGIDAQNDRFYAGMASAYAELLDIDFEDTK